MNIMINKSEIFKSYKSIFLIFFTALVGSGVGVFSKISLREIPPIAFTLIRIVLAIIVLLPFLLKSRRFHFKNLKKLFFVSLLATANVTLFVFGVGKTTATVSQLLYAGVPLIAGIFSFFLLKEKIYPKKILGMVMGFAGVIFIILLPVLGKHSAINGDLVGNLIILLAVFSISLYFVFSKQFQSEYTPLEITMFFFLVTVGIQSLLVPLEFRQHQNWWRTLSAEAIFGVFYVGVFATGVYYLVYQYAIKNTTPVIASMILYLQPIFAFFWASALLGEKITPEFLVGATFAFIGVALVTNFGKTETKKEFINKNAVFPKSQKRSIIGNIKHIA